MTHVVAGRLAAAHVHAAGEDALFHRPDEPENLLGDFGGCGPGADQVFAAHHLGGFGDQGASAGLDDPVGHPADAAVVGQPAGRLDVVDVDVDAARNVGRRLADGHSVLDDQVAGLDVGKGELVVRRDVARQRDADLPVLPFHAADNLLALVSGADQVGHVVVRVDYECFQGHGVSLLRWLVSEGCGECVSPVVGFRVQGSGFGVRGSGFRVQDLRFQVYSQVLNSEP